MRENETNEILEGIRPNLEVEILKKLKSKRFCRDLLYLYVEGNKKQNCIRVRELRKFLHCTNQRALYILEEFESLGLITEVNKCGGNFNRYILSIDDDGRYKIIDYIKTAKEVLKIEIAPRVIRQRV